MSNKINVITFIEKYCLINGKHIKLTNIQKQFLKYINKRKNK